MSVASSKHIVNFARYRTYEDVSCSNHMANPAEAWVVSKFQEAS